MSISLSILEYEPELSRRIDSLRESQAFTNIMKLIKTRRIDSIHIDAMRPPLIPDKTRFSIDLIRRLYEELKEEIPLNMHLMVSNPLEIIEDMNKFIKGENRGKVAVIVQVEAFGTEDETINAVKTIKRYGYRAGIGLNLPTPEEKLTSKIAKEADMILVMSVPMGLGGQKYHKEATGRLRGISKRFPDKIIEVDGGINPETVVEALRAGANIAVVGSYITLSDNPLEALLKIDSIIKSFKGRISP
ncbi:MAG: hypothetical protein QXR62_00300 [Candidatus Bathyarchaeia archaeon]|nr:hypothetical protein [Candidatus Bathyarchaeota archaeon]